MGRIFDTVLRYVRDHCMTVQADSEKSRILFINSDRDHRWEVSVRVTEDRGRVVVNALFPLPCPNEKRRDMAEFICWINAEWTTGCFALNMVTGVISFKTSLEVGEDARFDDNAIWPLFSDGDYWMPYYYDGIMKIIFGNASPKDVEEECTEKALASIRRKKDAKGESSDVASEKEDGSGIVENTESCQSQGSAPSKADNRLADIRAEFEKRLKLKGVRTFPVGGDESNPSQ